jgi:hypothetical protein
LEHHHFADEALKEATQDLLASADDTGCTADLTVVSADVLTQGKTDPRKDSLIVRYSGLLPFITDELSRSDAANAKRIRSADY